MKALFCLGIFFGLALTPALATASTRRPSQATLTKTFKLPVMVAGKPSGWVVANPGTVVTVEHRRPEQLLISLGGTSAWVRRSDTDFNQRLAAFKAAKEAAEHRLTQMNAALDSAAAAHREAVAADFAAQHAAYENPLDKGAYEQQRSVVDYYDHLGRRYNIGVFGQRIYN